MEDAAAVAISVSGQLTVQNEMTSRSYSAISASVHQDQADNHEHNWVYLSGFIPSWLGSVLTVTMSMICSYIQDVIERKGQRRIPLIISGSSDLLQLKTSTSAVWSTHQFVQRTGELKIIVITFSLTFYSCTRVLLTPRLLTTMKPFVRRTFSPAMIFPQVCASNHR